MIGNLPIIQIIIAILLMVAILLQNRGSGLSNIFGGSGNIYRTKRGLEKKLFTLTGWQPQKLDIQKSPAGSVKRRLADIIKIKKLVGWTPKTKLDSGLTKTIEWYKIHPISK